MATKANFKRSAKKWFNIFRLEGHTIVHVFHEDWVYDNGAKTISSHALEDGEKLMTVVTTSIPIYKSHTLDINMAWLKIASPNDVDETLCHEYLHILYSPLITFVQTVIMREIPDSNNDKAQVYYEWLRDINESVTTDVSRLITDLSNE